MSKLISLKRVCKYSNERIERINVTLENFVTTDNLLQNKLGITEALSLPPQENNLRKFNSENILVGNIRPYLKKIWFADRTGGCSADVLVFEVKKSAHPKFVYYSMFRDDFFSHAMKGSKGTKMPRGDKNQLLEFLIPEYDISTQQKISSVLSSLDSKIELNHRINRELEQMTKLLYNYWFVQFDFPDANGKPYKSNGGKMVWNKELKREIPEGWEVNELGTEIEIQRGISYTSKEINGDGIPMINLNSFNLDGTYKPDGVKFYSGKFTDKNIAKSGELLIAATDVTRNADIIGKAIMVPNYYENDLVFSMDIAKIIPLNIPCSFLMLLFNSNHYHNYIRWYATGTLVLHLNLDGVKRYKTEIPPINLLEKFDSLYQPIANRIYKTAKENHHLTTLRNWLLPMLMNGQVRVGEAGKKEYQPNEAEMDLAAEPGD